MQQLVTAIIFLIVFPLIISFLYMSKGRRHARKQKELNRRFIDEEHQANNVRKKDLEPELFYTAELTGLPPLPEGDPHQVERTSRRKMIRFSQPTTNLELKKKYGPAQMDLIAQYEENFDEYLKALTGWAESLSQESPGDALAVLSHAISLGSEFRGTYKLAADIYADRRQTDNMEALLDMVTKTHFRDPAIRQHILDYINRKLDEIQ